MDLNLVYLTGELAAPPEHRSLASGTRLARLLVSVRADMPRRRLDVVPVTVWEPDDDLFDGPARGARVWIAAQVHRRFWTGAAGRESRLEIVAHQVHLEDPTQDGDVWPPVAA